MKKSTLLMWILYGIVASVVMSYLDIYFGWGLFQ